MSEPNGNEFNASIQNLIIKLENLYQRQIDDNKRIDMMMSLLERFSDIVDRYEQEKNLEANINKKITLLNQSLERVISVQEDLTKNRDGADKTVVKILHGTKMLGQIMTMIAASIQMTIDNNATNPNIDQKNKAVQTQRELMLLLQPLNSLVKSLVEEKLDQQNLAENSDKPSKETDNKDDGNKHLKS